MARFYFAFLVRRLALSSRLQVQLGKPGIPPEQLQYVPIGQYEPLNSGHSSITPFAALACPTEYSAIAKSIATKSR
jgi:hypothetical protein